MTSRPMTTSGLVTFVVREVGLFAEALTPKLPLAFHTADDTCTDSPSQRRPGDLYASQFRICDQRLVREVASSNLQTCEV
jgi:hypothetical protein